MAITINDKDIINRHQGHKVEKHRPEIALCDNKILGKHWNKTQSPTNNNVYTTYIRKEENNHRYRIIDMGAFCLENDITPDMLKMGIRHIKEVAALLSNKEIEQHNKIVIMSEEDYKAYEIFKKIKAFEGRQ